MPKKAFESKDYRLLSSVSAQAILPQMAVNHQTSLVISVQDAELWSLLILQASVTWRLC